MREKGVGAILVPEFRWSRCDIKAIGLLGSVLAVQQAKEKGAEEAIFVRDGVVTEGTHTNVMAVFNGHLATHPLGNFILPGVTRGVVHGALPQDRDRLQGAGLPGGGAEPGKRDHHHGHEQGDHPIIRLDGRPVGTGAPGAVTRRLQAAYRNWSGDKNRVQGQGSGTGPRRKQKGRGNDSSSFLFSKLPKP